MVTWCCSELGEGDIEDVVFTGVAWVINTKMAKMAVNMKNIFEVFIVVETNWGTTHFTEYFQTDGFTGAGFAFIHLTSEVITMLGQVI